MEKEISHFSFTFVEESNFPWFSIEKSLSFFPQNTSPTNQKENYFLLNSFQQTKQSQIFLFAHDSTNH